MKSSVDPEHSRPNERANERRISMEREREKSRIRLPDSTIDNGQERAVWGTGLGAKNRHELASSRCGYYIDVR